MRSLWSSLTFYEDDDQAVVKAQRQSVSLKIKRSRVHIPLGDGLFSLLFFYPHLLVMFRLTSPLYEVQHFWFLK